MNLTGQELFNKVFADDIEQWGYYELWDIIDNDEVSQYDENVAEHDGWYVVYGITFRYNGKKYYYERKEHTSDNVDDTEYLMHTFKEIVETSSLGKAIENIITGIEDERYDSLEDIIQQLEQLKKDFQHLEEV